MTHLSTTNSNKLFPLHRLHTPTLINSTTVFHHRQKLARNSLRPLAQANQVQNMHANVADVEFNFWSATKTWYDESPKRLNQVHEHIERGFEVTSPSIPGPKYESSPLLFHKDHNKIWLQTRSPRVEQRFEVPSPPIWEKKMLPYRKDESSPPHTQEDGAKIWPKQRSQSIADGRKELMEMINNMPESRYELSLKDIVEEGSTEEGDHEKHKKDKKRKRKVKKPGQMVRISSMETEVFLIKSIFPSSFSFKKRDKAGNCGSKVVPRSSSEKPESKKCWIQRIFMGRNDRSRGKDHMNSNSVRHAKRDDMLPGCWLFFYLIKYNTKLRRREEATLK